MKKLVVVVDIAGGETTKELFTGKDLHIREYGLANNGLDILEGDKILASFIKYVYWRELE